MTTYNFNDGNEPVPAHQHSNGGGWVADTCNISAEVYVDANATVAGRVVANGNVRFEANARVNSNAKFSTGLDTPITVNTDFYLWSPQSFSISNVGSFNKQPKVIQGYMFPFILSDNHIHLGCIDTSHSSFLSNGVDMIMDNMDLNKKTARLLYHGISAFIKTRRL